MPARRSLAEILGTEEPTEDAPAATWGAQECECGAVFIGPEGRTRCLVCRTGATVVRVGRGVSEDDDSPTDVAARAQVPEEGEIEMPQPLGIDRTRVEAMIKQGTPAPVACYALGVTAIQFAHWCYRNHVKYPGVPTPNTAAVAQLQAEIDQIPEARAKPTATAPFLDTHPAMQAEIYRTSAAPVTTQSPARAIEAQIRAEVHAEAARLTEAPEGTPPAPAGPSEPAPAPEAVPEEALHVEPTAVTPLPEAAPAPVAVVSPFRAPVREGGFVLPIRIEGSRIVLREPEVEGDITDVEAAEVLAWLRGWVQERKGVEVVVEAAS